MKTTIKIILFIALIIALCGCTVKADAPTTTDKEPAPTETLSENISTEDVEDNATTADADITNQDTVTDDEQSPTCTATPAPTPTSDVTDTDNPAPTNSDSEQEPNPEPDPEPNPEPDPEPSATPAPTPETPTETLSAPSISISPTDTTRDPITVTITAPAEATKVKYQIDNLGYSVYTGPFTVDFNCKITAYAATHTVMSEYATKTITNYDSSPEPTPELTVSPAGSSYMQAVANAINAAKEAAGKPIAAVQYGGGAQSDAENILLGIQSGPSGLANWCRGSYSGTAAGNKLASGILMDASNIKIGAAKSSIGEYCIVVGFW